MLIDQVNDQLVLIDWSHEVVPAEAAVQKVYDYRGLLQRFMRCEKHLVSLDEYVMTQHPKYEMYYPVPEYRLDPL